MQTAYNFIWFNLKNVQRFQDSKIFIGTYNGKIIAVDGMEKLDDMIA